MYLQLRNILHFLGAVNIRLKRSAYFCAHLKNSVQHVFKTHFWSAHAPLVIWGRFWNGIFLKKVREPEISGPVFEFSSRARYTRYELNEAKQHKLKKTACFYFYGFAALASWNWKKTAVIPNELLLVLTLTECCWVSSAPLGLLALKCKAMTPCMLHN